MRRLIALLACTVLSVPVHAQAISAGGPGGGDVRDLVRAPGGPVYAGMARGGVFRSDDGGLTWAPLRDGMVRFGVNDLAFGTDGALYAAGARFGTSFDGVAAVYRLAPGATTWTDVTGNLAVFLGLPVESMLALPDGVLLAGYSGGLYRSANGGQTWTDVPSAQSKPFWTMLRASDGTLYAGSGSSNRVLRSDDAGLTWTAAGAGLPDVEYRAPLFEAADGAILAAPGLFFYTTTRGATWQQAAHPFPSSTGGFARDPDGRIHASGESGYVFSVDNGRSWTGSGHNSAGIYHFPRAIVRADDGRMLVGTRDHGVIRSDAAFYLWQPSNPGLGAARIYDLAAGPDGRFYAGAGDEAYRSATGAGPWEPLGARVAYAYTVAPTADAVFVGSLSGQVVRLRDGTRTSLGVAPGAGDVYSILPLASGRLVAYARGNIYVSDDAAATWTRTLDRFSGFDDTLIRGGDGHLYTANDDGLFRSTDDGQTWTLVTATFGQGQTIRVSEVAQAGGRLYAAVSNVVLRSADGGATWAFTQLPPFGNLVEVLHVDADGALWVGASYGLYRSGDGGATFEDRSAGLYDPSVTDILPLGAGTRGGFQGTAGLLVGTQGGGAFTVGAGGTAEEPTADASMALRLDAYPNPTAGTLTVAATVTAPGDVRVGVYDVLGRRVATVLDRALGAGRHDVPFDASALPAGVYTIRMEAGGVWAVRTFTRLR
ncbi:MAG TPA: T9SS type A sorting domain-containing protein [Rubricoccaceae bacterium]